MTDHLSGSTPPLIILHFNDVYNVEPRDQEPCGGASRFSTMIKSFAHQQPMILFSGDVFSPSICKNIFFILFEFKTCFKEF